MPDASFSRRTFLGMSAAAAAGLALGCTASQKMEGDSMATDWTNGEHYIPFEDRDGETSTVYFTRDLSAEGLRKAFAKIADKLEGLGVLPQ